jgi:hypothetical protein
MFDTVEIGILAELVDELIDGRFDIGKALFHPAFVYGKERVSCFPGTIARRLS